MTKKYLCIGDEDSYGTTLVGKGDTLTEAYEHFRESCDTVGGVPDDANNCQFYDLAAVVALALNVNVQRSITEITKKSTTKRRKK